jgi:acyl transferase domain-containing protein
VIEVGPHKTLLPALVETLSAVGKSVTAVPTLVRRKDCVESLLACAGKLFERGLELDMRPLVPPPSSYTLAEGLPPHPFIRRPLLEPATTFGTEEARPGSYAAGPTAGARIGEGHTRVEVSDRTCPHLLEHKIDGKGVVPGAFFLEMVVEAAGGLPLTLADVEFKSMLSVPMVRPRLCDICI